MAFVKVASKDEIESGRGKIVDVNGDSIAILNDKGKFFAISNTCAHMQGPLGEGSCDNGKVTCPWHGWTYDLKTGKNTFNNNIKLKVYEIKIKGKDILINPEAR